jgi:hypothetical protein
VIERVTNLGTAQRCTASQCNGGAAPKRSSNHSTCVRRTAVVDISLDVEDIPDNNWNQERIAEANNDVRNDLAADPGFLWRKALRRLLPLRRPDCVNLEKSAVVALVPLGCSICEKFFVRESNEVVHDISDGKTENRDFGVVGAEPLQTKQEIRRQDKRDPYQQKDDCPSSAKSERFHWVHLKISAGLHLRTKPWHDVGENVISAADEGSGLSIRRRSRPLTRRSNSTVRSKVPHPLRHHTACSQADQSVTRIIEVRTAEALSQSR